MTQPSGNLVVNSGVLHFVGSEWVATGESPKILFGRNSTGNQIDAHTTEYGMKIGIELGESDRYAGTVPFDHGGQRYKVYFVFDRVAEIKAGAFFQVTYTVTREG